MTVAQRLLDGGLAVSVVGWAIMGLARDGFCAVRVALAALHLLVAWLFIVRGPEITKASLPQLALAAPGALVGGLVFKFAAHPPAWPVHAVAVLVVGTILAIGALATLGRSFALLPGHRELVVRGPYKVVRHPAYLAELLLVAACVFAGAPWWIGLAAVPFLVVRIVMEERVLAADPGWVDYTARVRSRLVPGVW